MRDIDWEKTKKLWLSWKQVIGIHCVIDRKSMAVQPAKFRKKRIRGRVIKFKELLVLSEQYKHKNQYSRYNKSYKE